MTTDNPADALAGLTAEQLLELLNTLHGLRADKIASEYGITAEGDLVRIRGAVDEEGMTAVAEEIKGDAEYQAFYPSGPTNEPDDGYAAFFPNERR